MIKRSLVAMTSLVAFVAGVVAILEFFEIRLTSHPSFTREVRTLDDSSALHDFLHENQGTDVLLDITVIPRPDGVGDYDHWLEIGAERKIGDPLLVTFRLGTQTLTLTIDGEPFRFEKVTVRQLDGDGPAIAMRVEGLFKVGPVEHLGQGHAGAKLLAQWS